MAQKFELDIQEELLATEHTARLGIEVETWLHFQFHILK